MEAQTGCFTSALGCGGRNVGFSAARNTSSPPNASAKNVASGSQMYGRARNLRMVGTLGDPASGSGRGDDEASSEGTASRAGRGGDGDAQCRSYLCVPEPGQPFDAFRAERTP